MQYKSQFEGKVAKHIKNGYEFNMDKYLSEGWQLMKKNFITFLLLYLIAIIIVLIFAFFLVLFFGGANIIDNPSIFDEMIVEFYQLSPFLFYLVDLAIVILFAPLSVGFYWIIHKKERTGTSTIVDYFNGYKDFLQLALYTGVITIVTYLVEYLFINIGAPNFLSIVYTFLITILLMFGSLLITFNKYNFTTAIRGSFLLVLKKPFHIILLFIIFIVLAIFGLLALIIGIFVAIPYIYGIIYSFYRDICIDDEDAETDIEDNLLSEF